MVASAAPGLTAQQFMVALFVYDKHALPAWGSSFLAAGTGSHACLLVHAPVCKTIEVRLQSYICQTRAVLLKERAEPPPRFEPRTFRLQGCHPSTRSTTSPSRHSTYHRR